MSEQKIAIKFIVCFVGEGIIKIENVIMNDEEAVKIGMDYFKNGVLVEEISETLEVSRIVVTDGAGTTFLDIRKPPEGIINNIRRELYI